MPDDADILMTSDNYSLNAIFVGKKQIVVSCMEVQQLYKYLILYRTGIKEF
ncbi:MAG: hypothetical protein WBF33_25595 [Candidatus Nitrosopolaris sp.]